MGDASVARISLAEEVELVEAVFELVHGGVTVAAAYRLAANTLSSRPRAAAEAIANRLENGAPVAASTLESIRRVDPTHLAMLRMADATGDAEASFARATTFLSTRLRLRSQTMTAAIYPGFVVAVALAAAIILLVVVIPSAQRLVALGSAAVEAEAIIARGTAAVTAIIVTLGSGIGIAAGLLAARRSRRPSPTIDRVRLRVPIVGRMEVLSELLGFCHVLGGLLGTGEPFATALVIAARSVTNASLRLDLENAAVRVAQGHSATVLAAIFPGVPALRHYLALAEAGADLAASIDSLTVHLASKLDRSTARLGVLLEPALVVVAGTVVLAVVLTLVQPLFELYGSVLP